MEILLNYNANHNIKNNANDTCISITFSDDIVKLINNKENKTAMDRYNKIKN